MDVLIIVCCVGAIAMFVSKMIPSRIALDSARYDREMRQAYNSLREGRLNRQDSFSRSEYTANRMLAK